MAQPLHKTTPDGALYTRFPAIEAEVNAALAQDTGSLCRRATIRDPKTADYLSSECLLHLIREAGRRGDDAARDALLPLLLARCTINLYAKVDGAIAGAPQLREDILGEFAELFAIDGSPLDRHELDFFEVRFNMGFARFRISRVRAALSLQNNQAPWPEDLPANDVTAERELDDEVLARISDLKGDGNPEEKLFRKQVYAAIKALPPDERKAVILVHRMGFKRNPRIRTRPPPPRSAA